MPGSLTEPKEHVPSECTGNVMAGLVPASTSLLGQLREDVDARHRAGHDQRRRNKQFVGSNQTLGSTSSRTIQFSNPCFTAG